MCKKTSMYYDNQQDQWMVRMEEKQYPINKMMIGRVMYKLAAKVCIFYLPNTQLELTFRKTKYRIEDMEHNEELNQFKSYHPHTLAERSLPAYQWMSGGPFESLPELQFVSYADLPVAIPLGENRLEEVHEFVYVEKGRSSWKIADESYEILAGQMLHICPHELHKGGFDVIEPCRLWAFVIFTPFTASDAAQNWLQLSNKEIHYILEQLLRVPRIMSVGIAPLQAFRRLFKAIHLSGTASRMEGKTAILELLLTVIQAKYSSHDTEGIFWKLQKLIDNLEQHSDERPSVQDLANKLGISISYLHRIFQEFTGLTPMEYMERLRIKEARRLLSDTNMSITEIAFQLGYATSQHFSTVFRRMIGKTPTQWRENPVEA